MTGAAVDPPRSPGLRSGDAIDIALDDMPTEARRVRRMAAAVLEPLDGDHRWVDDAMVVISELVSNALVHGAPPRTVRLARVGTALLIEVFDGSRHAPHLVEPVPTTAGGHGLQLVARLTSTWGTRLSVDGKCVWCTVTVE